MTEKGICPYCGTDYTDPEGVVSDQYRKEGHMIVECDEIPKEHWMYLNYPGVDP